MASTVSSHCPQVTGLRRSSLSKLETSHSQSFSQHVNSHLRFVSSRKPSRAVVAMASNNKVLSYIYFFPFNLYIQIYLQRVKVMKYLSLGEYCSRSMIIFSYVQSILCAHLEVPQQEALQLGSFCQLPAKALGWENFEDHILVYLQSQNVLVYFRLFSQTLQNRLRKRFWWC